MLFNSLLKISDKNEKIILKENKNKCKKMKNTDSEDPICCNNPTN